MMGNFSRDTFKETNILTNLLNLAAPVTNPRQYVGVRLQQGVPILDADWNELEDLRRYDLQACLKHFFGDGIPDGNKGFEIAIVTQDNNFKIEAGLALVEGMLVINSNPNLTYSDQATLFSLTLPPLAPPNAGTRNDLVYLDTWEEERNGSASDPRLIDSRIGIETCTRIERRWVVRTAPGVSDLSGIVQDAGHTYLELARLHRVEGGPRILQKHIEDRRRTQINVAKYLQTPVFVERGTDRVDIAAMAQLFDALRLAFETRMESNLLFVGSPVAEHSRSIVYFAVTHIMQICVGGALQAKNGNLTTAGALEALVTLHDAQNGFLDKLEIHGEMGSAKTTFISQYRLFLTGGGVVPGLQPALVAKDLIGAFKAQQEIIAFLAPGGDVLPAGGVTRQFLSVSPFVPLVAGQSFEFTVEFASGVTSDQTSEVFDITASLTSALWSVTPATSDITLTNLTGKGTKVFNVTPHVSNPQADLQVIARARRNPDIETKQLPLNLQLGQRPAVAAKLMYAGPALVDGLLKLSDGALHSGGGFDVNFVINNRTNDPHSYSLRSEVSLSVGSLTGWLPTAATPGLPVLVANANSTRTAAITITKSGVSAVDNQGTLQVRLFRIDDIDLPLEEQELVTIPFIVVA